ncbi:sulfite exporter TauE/SafE family protein [Calidifontibacter sp. DB0510]|uniref:Probable membrane transporter protein n=1 Tax=Metallococcus carri TaxID=1656884 RepID=A0A967B585_9MICO|nr:sulfite exporter TauE/SafE family protein [Metallococcus carri]NHN54866.1 sulfite exporter TauE/SafE family protein [Metallococcus carri]NOP37211.1 sulfite exporter TauE/SafE family protein [Calidifontibacter sp. DB2511S]
MTLTHALLILLAGMAAGTINTIVGSGTLVTFPTLLAFGYPAVAANVSNSLGLVAGGISGTIGYRKELAGAGADIRRLAPMSFLGAITGALLLIWLPASAFDAIVPVLILLGIVLVIAGPRLQQWAKAHHADHESTGRRVALGLGVFGAGVYGGYFGAAQGVLLIGLMSVLMAAPLQRINGLKNVLSTIVNAVAALTFLVIALDKVDWAVAGLIAAGSLIGGVIGARVGRRLHPNVLRAFIVIVGVVTVVWLLTK